MTGTVEVRALPAMTPEEKLRLVPEILVDYARVRWLLWRRTLPEVVATLRGDEALADHPLAFGSEEHLRGLRLGRAVTRVLGLLPTDGRCLMRSLVLLSMLARRGQAVTLVLAARTEPDFLAHAWVERVGEPLLPPRGAHYKRLTEV